VSTEQMLDSSATPGVPAGYAAIWDLFTDWCAVTGSVALPAQPATVVAFLVDCPCAPATRRRRVTAIDHQHTAAGLAGPGESPAVLAVLGRPTGEIPAPSPATVGAVDAALRGLPSHGWTQGMFGRRDRCLLVLSQLAGVPYRHLARLTAGDLGVADGVTMAADVWRVAADPDPVLCGSCAVTRWLRLLDLVVTRISNRAIAPVLKKATPLTERSPHLCRSTRPLDQATLGVPLLPPIDQWGYVPFPVKRLTPHSLSRRVRDLLAGDLGAHRDLPVDTDEEPETSALVPVVDRKVYSREDSQRAWAKRRADLDQLAGVDDLLSDVDARVMELDRRTAAILAGQTDSNEPRSGE
jgi:hypothetical protein